LFYVCRDQVIGDDVGQEVEPEKRNLGEDTAFLGDSGGQNVIKGGNAVGSDEKQLLVVQGIDVPDLAAGMKLEIGDFSL
jgi:hypothetical protein